MSCGCSGHTADEYLRCVGIPIPPPIVDDATLISIAASAGAKSSDFTMCLAVAELKARRMIYYKAQPGDCGGGGFYYTDTTQYEAQAAGLLSTIATVDKEPISRAVLAGVSAIFGGFLAAHAAAVQKEQTTLCQVATTYNQAITQLEKAVALGQVRASDAAAFLSGQAQQLDGVMQTIYKVCNAACGYRIAMRAMVDFNTRYVFPALEPYIPQIAPVTAPFTNIQTPPAAGTPGSGGPLTSAVPTMLPTSVQLPTGNGLILVGGGLLAARLTGVL